MSRPTRLRPAQPPRRAPPLPDPPVVCLGFGFNRFHYVRTTAPGSDDLAQNPIRKGRPVQGTRKREFVRDAITGT